VRVVRKFDDLRGRDRLDGIRQNRARSKMDAGRSRRRRDVVESFEAVVKEGEVNVTS